MNKLLNLRANLYKALIQKHSNEINPDLLQEASEMVHNLNISHQQVLYCR